jgi:hypothetical protein
MVSAIAARLLLIPAGSAAEVFVFAVERVRTADGLKLEGCREFAVVGGNHGAAVFQRRFLKEDCVSTS